MFCNSVFKLIHSILTYDNQKEIQYKSIILYLELFKTVKKAPTDLRKDKSVLNLRDTIQFRNSLLFTIEKLLAFKTNF